jgi:hypothetical protein
MLKRKKVRNKSMKVKGLFKKVIAVATVVSVMIFSTIGVYAKYSDSTSDYAYAGDTRFLYTLKMDEFSAYAAELTLNGYVLFSAYYDNEKYSFSAADQLGYSIGAGRQTPFLTRYSYCKYFVGSETGSTFTNASLTP